jgi:hypothetical protein
MQTLSIDIYKDRSLPVGLEVLVQHYFYFAGENIQLVPLRNHDLLSVGRCDLKAIRKMPVSRG